jgi:hypothetical protein
MRTLRILFCKNDIYCCKLLQQHSRLCIMSPTVVEARSNVHIMLASLPTHSDIKQWLTVGEWIEFWKCLMAASDLFWNIGALCQRVTDSINTGPQGAREQLIIKRKQCSCGPSKWIVKCSACMC